MMTTSFGGIPQFRRELWLRQLIRKWSGLNNGGSSKFDRDSEMDVECKFEEDQRDSEEDSEEVYNDVDKKEVHPLIKSDVVADVGESTTLSLLRGQSETLRQQFIDHHEFRVSVHTWNVAGKPPPNDLDMKTLINTSQPADIYVFGFQEVVPLNANNVLGVEDEGPGAMWEAKIRETLNKGSGQHKTTLQKSLSMPSPPGSETDVMVTDVPEVSNVSKLLAEFSSNFQQSANLVYKEILPNNETYIQKQKGDTVSVDRSSSYKTTHDVSALASCEAPGLTSEGPNETISKNDVPLSGAPPSSSIFPWSDVAEDPPTGNVRQYSRVASKQMAGLFIIVWIRSHLWRHVHNVQVSTVGCGLMNHLGNKGSISVSMFLHHTSFCFVCSHLTSGHKEGDALRRNADVAEILRRTRFPRLAKLFGLGVPETILAHDRVIWLGDLNYRLALPDMETWSLVKRGDWGTLLRMDQLKLEQGEGRVFPDWQEGPIYFPPTYKYMNGSDQYSSGDATSGGKRRSPAWCDRVLWYGEGLKQLAYKQEDSRLSDHRSVSATFTADVEIVNRQKLKKACVYPRMRKWIYGSRWYLSQIHSYASAKVLPANPTRSMQLAERSNEPLEKFVPTAPYGAGYGFKKPF